MSERVIVLYIGGHGRSGSTILAQTLGQMPGFVNVGELWQVWYRGLRDNERCGCGQPFYSCDFWNTVGGEAFDGWDSVDVNKMWAFRPALKRLRYIPHHLLAAKTGIYDRRMKNLQQECSLTLDRLYHAVQSVSGARVIVDSSKRSPYALLLSTFPFVDLRVVHLIRDSRAVAYSWTKKKVRPEVVGRRDLMPRLSPVKASRAWSLENYSYSLVSRFANVSCLRYEDFVRDPAFYISSTLTELGFEDEVSSLRFTHGQEISLPVEHTISGNPNRFRTGAIKLRADEEWKLKMKRADKNVVTALTAPLLLKHGYLRIGKESN